jgi:hypothetical protein
MRPYKKEAIMAYENPILLFIHSKYTKRYFYSKNKKKMFNKNLKFEYRRDKRYYMI